MTVNYISAVATAKTWTFMRLLFRWRGSIYKIIWFEMLFFIIGYTGFSFLYHFGLYDKYKLTFEHFCRLCKFHLESIPVSFVLGFYVSLVVQRWMNQFWAIPWPDNLAIYLSSFVTENTEKAMMLKRTVIRYANLSLCMTMSAISPSAKKTFPNTQAFIDNGLLTEVEKNNLDQIVTVNNKYFIPITWATKYVEMAFKEGMFTGQLSVDLINDELANFRGKLGTLFCYDWINPPLVYTQIATVSVYMYFFFSIFGEQFLDEHTNNVTSSKVASTSISLYVPVFALFKFLFLMGWLKVAESHINPFGNDDDDFEISEIIRRNIKVSYTILDEMDQTPEFLKSSNMDKNWDPEQSFISTMGNKDMFIGSIANLDLLSVEENQLQGSILSLFTPKKNNSYSRNFF